MNSNVKKIFWNDISHPKVLSRTPHPPPQIIIRISLNSRKSWNVVYHPKVTRAKGLFLTNQMIDGWMDG
jgi:hypothetical protein